MRWTPLALALAVLLGAPVVACGGDDGPAPATDAEAARAVCTTLVDWTDDVAAIVNATQLEMQEGVDLRPLMLDALDRVIARTEALGAEEAALALPDDAGGDELAAALAEGQQAALADLEAFRAEVAAIPDPDPESTNYRKAQLVVELEKPRSLVKPDASGDLGDADLEAALQAEERCRFVVRVR